MIRIDLIDIQSYPTTGTGVVYGDTRRSAFNALKTAMDCHIKVWYLHHEGYMQYSLLCDVPLV